jgi:hypothetical protein
MPILKGRRRSPGQVKLPGQVRDRGTRKVILDGDERLAAAIGSTTFSILTMSAWLAFFKILK